jgi:hypothetical protein
MERREFLIKSGWCVAGIAASGSLLKAADFGTKEAKKIMPSPTGLHRYWGDLHNHCNITYGHGDMRDAFEAAKQQLDFVSVTPHAMWPDIPGKRRSSPELGDKLSYFRFQEVARWWLREICGYDQRVQ